MIPTSYLSSFFSLVLQLLESVCPLAPSHFISIMISATTSSSCVRILFLWMAIAAEVVPEGWCHWSSPSQTSLLDDAFTQLFLWIYLDVPIPQASLCNRSILAPSKVFSFIVFGTLPHRQETQPEDFCISSMTPVP